MAKSIVVVVDGDAWVHRALAAGVPADEIDVVPCSTARGGLNACCALEPDCVVAEYRLADLDGLWLAKSLREQPAAIASTPFILLTAEHREDVRLRALRGGVDVFVPKPFNVVELVAQVRALIAMAQRMRGRRDSVLPGVGPASVAGEERAVVGHLSRISIATVLAALELERRSGELTLSGGAAGRRRLVLEIASGALAGGRLAAQRLRPLDALAEALRWEGKRFQFTPGESVAAPPNADSIGSLVLAAIRREELASTNGLAEAGAPARGQTRPPLPPRTSGTMAKVAPPPMPDRGAPPTILPPPPVTGPRRATGRPKAPGRRLVESMMPSMRPDPRAEPADETTHKLGTRARRG